MGAFRILGLALLVASSAHALPADEPVDPATAPPPVEKERPKHNNTGTPQYSDRVETPSSVWPISLNFHGGLTFDSEDPDVRTSFQHDIWYSYLVSGGAFWNFPKMFGTGFWLFAGSEFSYLHNEEELTSDQASSYLHSDTMEFFATAGLGWQPGFFNSRAGFQAFVATPIWGQKTTGFDAKDYSHDLGSRDVRIFAYGLSFFYDIDHRWKPYVGYEYRVGSILTVGLNYAF